MKDSVLVLGAGNSLRQHICVTGSNDIEPEGNLFTDNFKDVWTIDIDHRANPKVEWDLERFPWPVPTGYFDEVHAYEVLEHLGAMGDYEFFFELWKQIWDILKPGGLVCGSTPWWESVWAWQDPGHRRVYSPELLLYLEQTAYAEQIGVTAMTDYRRIFPPPYSFKMRYWQRTGLLADPEAPIDPKFAGFKFVLQKEVYGAG